MVRLVLLLLGLTTTTTNSSPVVKEGPTVEFTGFNCHEAQTKRMLQPRLCRATPARPLAPTSETFDLFQRQVSTPLTGISCEIKLTEMTGRCGFMSHWEWLKAPTFNHPHTLQAYSCKQLWESRTYTHLDLQFPITEGINQFSYLSAGSFTAVSGGELSCIGETVHYGGTILDQALIMIHADVRIYPIKLLKSLSSGAATVTSPLAAKGVGLEAADVKKGELVLPDRTIVINPEAPNVCHLVKLRQEVVLTQLFSPTQEVSSIRMSPLFTQSKTVKSSHRPSNISNIIWTSPGLTLLTRAPSRLPSACGNRIFYKTSHPNVLVSRSASPANISYSSETPFVQDPAYSLSERLELQLLDLSSKINNLHQDTIRMECSAQAFMSSISTIQPNLTDGFTEYKMKIIPLGETLLVAACPQQKYTAKANEAAPNGTSVCTHELLVRDSHGNKRYLSPVERYARKTPTFSPCPAPSPDEHTAYAVFQSSSTGLFYFRDKMGALQIFNSDDLMSPYDKPLRSDTTVFFKEKTDSYMTSSQLSIIDGLDPILMTAVRGHMRFNQPTSVDTGYVINRGQTTNGGSTGMASHTTWELYLFSNIFSMVGGAVSSSAIYTIKFVSLVGGAAYFCKLMFLVGRLYFCARTTCVQKKLSPELQTLVSAEVSRLFHEQRGNFADFRSMDTAL